MTSKSELGYGGYVLVWAGLVVLAVATLLLSFALRGEAGVVSALAFASLKAFLVVWFFMHMSHEGLSSRFAFLIAVLFLVLLIAFTLGDVMLRPVLEVHLPLSR